MNGILVPTTGPDNWKQFLADPEKQWKPGYSAQELAKCWEHANGLPSEVSKLFGTHFAQTELLLAIPEYKVRLPGGGRDSQNDLFCLLRADGATIALMVEGKVEEPFGSPLSEWLRDASDGKRERLSFISKNLGLEKPIPPTIRYQLLHRTASAIITAKRFGASKGAMVVHSFSAAKTWLTDFQAFAGLWGLAIDHDEMMQVTLPDGFQLLLGWASGRVKTRQNSGDAP